MPFPYTDKIGPETPVKAREGDSDCVHASTLSDFFAANADGIDPAERMDIVLTLATGAPYRGGGGAAAEWSLELAQ